MLKSTIQNRVAWLVVGVLCGISLASFWPRETLRADSADRDSKFAMLTLPVSPLEEIEGVFVLDFLTGQLTGAVIDNKSGKFVSRYARNLAVDFNVDPKAEPHYAIVGGRANLPNIGGTALSTGVLYVGELSSGRVLCYSFPYQQPRRGQPPQLLPLQPMDTFQFREAVQLQ